MAEYEDESYETDAEKPKGLRAQLEKELAEKKELKEELDALRGEVRKNTLSSLLTAKGINTKVIKFIDDDVTDEETLNAWLADNADLFGSSETTEVEDATPNATSEEINSAKKLGTLNEVASTPGKIEELNAKIANAKDKTELNEALQELRQYML